MTSLLRIRGQRLPKLKRDWPSPEVKSMLAGILSVAGQTRTNLAAIGFDGTVSSWNPGTFSYTTPGVFKACL